MFGEIISMFQAHAAAAAALANVHKVGDVQCVSKQNDSEILVLSIRSSL